MTSHVTVLWIVPTERIVDKGDGAIDQIWVVSLNRLIFESVSEWRVCTLGWYHLRVICDVTYYYLMCRRAVSGSFQAPF